MWLSSSKQFVVSLSDKISCFSPYTLLEGIHVYSLQDHLNFHDNYFGSQMYRISNSYNVKQKKNREKKLFMKDEWL